MKKLILLFVFVMQFMFVHAELVYFGHRELHLMFTLNTSTKEATVGTGNSYYIEGSDLLRFENATYYKSMEEEPNFEWWRNIVIPETIECVGLASQVNGYENVVVDDVFTVVGLANGAFWGMTDIETISLPETISSINSYAFQFCSNIEYIELPESVTMICANAFQNCFSLKQIGLPNGLEYIGEQAFADCRALESISIPGTVLTIANDAFSWCTNLSTLVFEDGEEDLHCGYSWIRSIEHSEGAYEMECRGLFGDCPITSLYLGRNLYGATSITRYYPPFLGLHDYGTPFMDTYICEGKTFESVVFGDKVTVITKNLFDYCYFINEITLPTGLVTIEDEAFYTRPTRPSLFQQRELVLPETLKNVGIRAFGGSNNLSIIYANSQVPPSHIENYLYYPCIFYGLVVIVPPGCGEAYRTHENWNYPNLKIIDPLDDIVTINVKTSGTLYSRLLAQGYQTHNVYKLKLKGTLNDEDWATIKDMSNLYDLDLSELNCEELSLNFLNDLTILYKFKFPEVTTKIPDNLFQNYTSLTGVIDIPESCKYIGKNAFQYTTIDEVVFNGELTIAERAFQFCINIDTLAITNKTIIEEEAFHSSGIRTLSVGGCGTSIGNESFGFCTNLRDVTFYDTITYIGKDSFFYCDSLNKLLFDGFVDTFGLCGWNNVKEVYASDLSTWCKYSFPSLKTNPLYYAEHFYINDELAVDITIPNDITVIKDYTFYNCTDLTNVEINDSVKGIGVNAFYSCNLENIKLPPNLEYIGDSAFYNCQYIDEVKFPLSLLSIGESAFRNCSDLKLIVADWHDPFTISENTFWGVSSDCYLYIPILSAVKYLQANWIVPNMRETGILSVVKNIGGTISVELEEDSENEYETIEKYYFMPYASFDISIIPDEGYSVRKVKLNGENVTNLVVDNVLFVEEPEENIVLTIVFADNSIVNGDVNGDGEVNDLDVIRVMKHIVKDDTDGFYDYASDLNNDEIINMTDAVMILNDINSKKTNKKDNL